MRSSLFFVIPLLAVLSAGRLPAADEKKTLEPTPPSEIGGKKLKEWIAEIKDPDPGVVENAIRTVVHFGRDAREAGPALIDQLENNRDSSIRTNAAIALGTLNQELHSADISKAVDKLGQRMTDDGQTIVRFHATLALSRFGADAKPALNKLVLTSRDGPSWEIRKAAVIALGAAAADKDKGPDPKGPDPRAVSALVGALSDKCAQVRLEAVIAIGILGKPASKTELDAVLTALAYRFKDHDKAVQIWAYTSYMALDGVNAKKLSEIAKHLKNPELAARCHAAKALSMFGSEAEAHIPELVETLHDKQPTAAAAAAEALASMDKDLKAEKPKSVPKVTARIKNEVLPIMADMVKDKDLDEGLRQVLLIVLQHYDSNKPAKEKPGEKAGK
jgi:HEAT repeat protein